jgi:hypothetical protein
MTDFSIFAYFFTSNELHQRYRDGFLAPEWASAYPMIFDHDDLRIAETQSKKGYHYFEWLSAILLFHTNGLLSLVECYTFRSHPRKRSLVERLCGDNTARFLFDKGVEARAQCPDLLVYHPDLSYWFFCEVKGPTDRIQDNQVTWFHVLEEVTGKKVYLIQLSEVKGINNPKKGKNSS